LHPQASKLEELSTAVVDFASTKEVEEHKVATNVKSIRGKKVKEFMKFLLDE